MNTFIPNNEHFLKRARNIRNELLNKTDRYFLIDYPIAYDQQMIIKAYRQELRDFINNNKDLILTGAKVDFFYTNEIIFFPLALYIRKIRKLVVNIYFNKKNYLKPIS
jgi:hypothetical protein